MAISGINSRLIPAFTTEDYFVDKNTGEPLNGGTVEFFSDAVTPITPKNVYQLSGAFGSYSYASLGSTLTLNNTGQIIDQNNAPVVLYWYPYLGSPNDATLSDTIDLYYMRVKDSSGRVQYTWSALPNVTADNDALEDFENYLNQIANPQFTQTFIGNTESIVYTLTSSATDAVYPFAPDWDFLISTGSNGTVTVTRVALTGASGTVTNPPYYIQVSPSAGITSCKLRQKFNVNSGLWASTSDNDIYLAAGVAAKAVGSSVALTMFYQESAGGLSTSPIEILNQSATTAGFAFLKNDKAVQITASGDTNSGADGYAQIYLNIPCPSTVQLSSFLVMPVSEEIDMSKLRYDYRTSNRNEALMGDYYIPALSYRHAESILKGWDFPVNPAQFIDITASTALAATPAYILDQTIAKDTAGSATFTRNTDTYGLQFTTVGTNNAIAICQFLSGRDVKAILGGRLSVNVNAFRTSAGGAVTMRIYLYRGTNAAAFPSIALNEFIATLGTDGQLATPFTGWAEIPRNNLPTATATLNTIATLANINDADNDYGFNNWEITDATQIDDTEKFCIAVTFGYVAASTVFTVNSVSLVPGDIPCRPSPKNEAETLVDCQYYYRKSYEVGIAVNPNPATELGAFQGVAIGVTGSDIVLGSINWSPPMRVAPTIVTYNPAVVSNSEIRNITASQNATATTGNTLPSRSGFYITYTDPGWTIGQRLAVQWSADARLGL